MQAKRLIWILWPSFIVAGAAEALFFTVFDPQDLSMFGDPLHASRTAIYSAGFFMFWAFAACSPVAMQPRANSSGKRQI